MASIADLLGVQWDANRDAPGEHTLTHHAQKQATEKGIPHHLVLDAANNPSHTYENGRYAGQKRHIKNGIVAVVETASKRVRTVYKDQEETAIRPDQQDADAQKYARRTGQR